MSKKTSRGHDPLWAQAKQVCRLNQEDIMMAKRLGMTPKSLIKNNPSPSQKWKQPVKYWIGELHQKRFGQELMIRQTLTSLADVECITLHRDRLEILLLEASSNRFMGLLRPGATPEVAPGLEVPAGYVFRLEPLCPPQGIVTFQRRPPPPPAAVEDEDIPF